jgi:hypothetical protein
MTFQSFDFELTRGRLFQKRVVRTDVANQGRIQDFKLGGTHLKKMRRAEGGAKIFGIFRVKNHDFTPKNHIFSNCGGRCEIFAVFRANYVLCKTLYHKTLKKHLVHTTRVWNNPH